MTHELGPAARALLDAARQGLGPDAAALQRVRARVDASVAAGVTTGAVAAKLGALVIVAAIAAGAFIYTTRYDDARAPHLQRASDVDAASVAPAPSVSSHAAASIAAAPDHVATAQPPHIEMPPTRVGSASPRAAALTRTPPAAATEPVARPTPPRGTAPIDLGREVELLDRAMAALRAGNPADALAAVRIHTSETRNSGQLAEDAAAIEIEALCHLHDRRVVAKLEAFDARWPESAQRSRLSTSCF